MFGSQFNSMRPSPPGTVFAVVPKKGSKPGHTFSSSKLAYSTMPGPYEPGTRINSCGVQHLSYFKTGARVRLSKDERFGYVERYQKAVKTPGPGSYNPC